jgi:ribonuclease R
LTEEEEVTLEEKASHISTTERTSSDAERSAVDRFTAAWMSERIGAEFSGTISSVTRFGLFVSLDENGADGLIPMRTLPDDYYIHDEKQHALIGRKHKRVYRLGAKLQIKLKEADGMTGSSLFEVANDKSADIQGVKFKRSRDFGRNVGRNNDSGTDRPKGGKKRFKGEKKGRKTPGKTTPRGANKPKKKSSYSKKR